MMTRVLLMPPSSAMRRSSLTMPTPLSEAIYGKTYWGVLRATFIIDGEGTIAHVIPKASPKTHDDEVLKVLGEMAAA